MVLSRGGGSRGWVEEGEAIVRFYKKEPQSFSFIPDVLGIAYDMSVLNFSKRAISFSKVRSPFFLASLANLASPALSATYPSQS